MNNSLFMVLRLLLVLLSLVDFGCGECPNMVSRARWGARAPQQVDYQSFPIHNVIICHTVTSRCKTQAACARTLSNIQTHHMDDRNYSDIGFNFMIGGDGKIYQGRGWIQEGAHTLGWNSRSLGIAFIGNFEESPASEEEIKALRDLLDCGVENGFLSNDFKLFGQRQLQATLSPGYALYLQLQDIPAWSEIV